MLLVTSNIFRHRCLSITDLGEIDTREMVSIEISTIFKYKISESVAYICRLSGTCQRTVLARSLICYSAVYYTNIALFYIAFNAKVKK